MASLAVLSPRSPTTTSPLSLPHGSRSFSGSASFPAAPAFGLSPNPASLMERRGRKSPALSVTAFHTASTDSHTRTDTRVPTSCRPSTDTLYDVLGVARTASESEIKSSYRRLARQFHPDVAPVEAKEASTNMFLKVHSAYVALSDPQSKARYDLQLSIQEFQSAGYKGGFVRAGDMKMTHQSPIRTPTSSYCAPRSPYSVGRGKSWESDQCWC